MGAAAAAPHGQPQWQLPQSHASQTEHTKPLQTKTEVAKNFNMERSPQEWIKKWKLM
jgi:hypothetical protein